MRIVILTTETPHHAFFVRELKAAYSNVVVFCETATSVKTFFPTHHAFEDERDRYEWQSWFGGTKTKISEIAPTHLFDSINSDAAVKALVDSHADVIIVFGTGVLRAPVISVKPQRVFNLHGGDPETYRGLDSHLWAIYHREFDGLITTLHRLDADLDNGDIVIQGNINLLQSMPIYALRRANTEICVTLSMAAIDMIQRHGNVVSRPQRMRGRYYSAMPSELKDICKEQFESYTARLDNNSR